MDSGSLRPVERRADGTIIVDAYIARIGVLEYQMPDGTVRRELRRSEDVFHPVSLRSFEGRPVTHEHPPDLLDAKTATRYAVGAQTASVVRDGEHVRTRLSIYDARTVAAMESGKLQISCGYSCDCIEQGGVDPIHGPFDAIQINIVGNHIAIVEAGRAGPTASARLDAWTWELPRAKRRDFDPSQERAPDGRFGTEAGDHGGEGKSAGAAGNSAPAVTAKPSTPSAAMSDRAKRAMADKDFVTRHQEALSEVAAQIREKYPREERAKDSVSAEVKQAIAARAEQLAVHEDKIKDARAQGMIVDLPPEFTEPVAVIDKVNARAEAILNGFREAQANVTADVERLSSLDDRFYIGDGELVELPEDDSQDPPGDEDVPDPDSDAYDAAVEEFVTATGSESLEPDEAIPEWEPDYSALREEFEESIGDDDDESDVELQFSSVESPLPWSPRMVSDDSDLEPDEQKEEYNKQLDRFNALADASKAKYTAAAEKLEAAREARQAAIKERAEKAQTSLETLLAAQVEARAELVDLEKQFDKAKDKLEDFGMGEDWIAEQIYELDDESERSLSDKEIETEYGAEIQRRYAFDDAVFEDNGATEAIKDSNKALMSFVKELSKITGREPAIPKPAGKKPSRKRADIAAVGLACKNGAMAVKPKKRKDGDPRKGKLDPAIAELQADACAPDDEPMPLVEDAADPADPTAEAPPESEPVPTSDEEDLEELTEEEIDELDDDELANMDEPDVEEPDPELEPEIAIEDGEDLDIDLEDEPEETTDAYDGMFDEDGEMTEAARGKMSASSFAIPSKSKLPIYDADTVKAAMRRFGEHEFDSAEERHAAYNRINGRARSFGINTKKFERTHGSKLDAARTSMTQDQKARRDSVRAKIKRRFDALRNENAGLKGRIVGLTRDLEAARAARKDSADVPRLVAERAALVAQAVAVKVPKFDSADAASMTAVAAMDNLAIKRAIVKHLDGEDLPADKHPQFIEAVYQSAIKRARNDEARARTGAAALAAARPAVTTTTTVGVEQQRNDSLPDEQAARAALRSNTATSWQRPAAHKE